MFGKAPSPEAFWFLRMKDDALTHQIILVRDNVVVCLCGVWVSVSLSLVLSFVISYCVLSFS